MADHRVGRKVLMLASLGLAIVGAIPGTARAEYPDRPIKVVVPFSPGGGTDLIARTLAKPMAEKLGQSIVVENRAGAGTIIGSDVVARSQPDGYTLLIATLAHSVNPSLHAKLPYDTDKAFAPVTLIGTYQNILVVKPDSPFKTVEDVIKAAKANPGKYTYASQGIGTSAHLAGELLNNLAHIELTHIPYKGAGPALTDVLGGQVDMMFASSAAVSGFIASKSLRPIAVTGAKGQTQVPGVPSVEETVPGYVFDSWYGLYVPAKTPKPVIDKLLEAVKFAAQDPDFLKRAQDEGLLLRVGTPDELDAYVKADTERWRKVVTENKIKPE
ncbi:Bug family tripartite tricarboxylate transporter substrate binding protein [Bradyrhizobium sp. HKCCYLRH2060]|uniref:Bug family tripartite tricarboxylate transporter substrate binding protein n=1 Tax=Bradyrhizobium TaxID=374 RepID=UPI0029161DC6|nr:MULTISPECIES: tripartite tricarboxylate transporter substrate binding protein [unclassified Bradyrhizobium]